MVLSLATRRMAKRRGAVRTEAAQPREGVNDPDRHERLPKLPAPPEGPRRSAPGAGGPPVPRPGRRRRRSSSGTAVVASCLPPPPAGPVCRPFAMITPRSGSHRHRPHGLPVLHRSAWPHDPHVGLRRPFGARGLSVREVLTILRAPAPAPPLRSGLPTGREHFPRGGRGKAHRRFTGSGLERLVRDLGRRARSAAAPRTVCYEIDVHADRRTGFADGMKAAGDRE